jgi:hypothetical protein
MTRLAKSLVVAVAVALLPGMAAAAESPARPLYSHRHFGIPIYGPDCRHRNPSPYCDYGYYKGPIFIDGRWVYGGSFPHRYRGGHHQFLYRGAWHNGGWGHGGHWGGKGGYRGPGL